MKIPAISRDVPLVSLPMNKTWTFVSLCTAVLLVVLLPGCSIVGGNRQGTTSAQARDRVLPVIEEPPSLGWKRIQYQSSVCPAFKEFIHAKGLPSFVIEDTGLTTRKIVVFYDKTDQAYLVSVATGVTGQKFEVSGPEPIGKQTHALFDALHKLELAQANLEKINAQTKKMSP